MNKKYTSYITIVILCLNLLTPTSNALDLNEKKDSVTYENETEKYAWENLYMPCSKYLKIVNRNTTILDIAKMNAADPYNGAELINKIKKSTYHEMDKDVVRWERDNEYIIEEAEADHEITPAKRLELLKEIEEEEEKERKEISNFGWKFCKTAVTTLTFLGTFGVSKYKGISTTEATKLTSLIFMGISTIISVGEIGFEMAWKKTKRLFTDKNNEEIKKPRLVPLPKLKPKNYKKVDVYTYGL